MGTDPSKIRRDSSGRFAGYDGGANAPTVAAEPPAAPRNDIGNENTPATDVHSMFERFAAAATNGEPSTIPHIDLPKDPHYNDDGYDDYVYWDEVSEFEDAGITDRGEMGQWKGLGISGGECAEYRSLHPMSLEEAAAWKRCGVGGFEYSAYRRAGLTGAQQIQQWRKMGVGGFECGQFAAHPARYVGELLSVEEVSRWKQAGIDGADYANFQLAHVSTLKEAEEWNAAGIGGGECYDYRRSYAHAFDDGFSEGRYCLPLGECKPWAELGVGGREMAQWLKCGVGSAEEAHKWRQINVDPQSYTEFVEAGVTTPSKAENWMRVGVYSKDVSKYLDAGPSTPRKVSEWRRANGWRPL